MIFALLPLLAAGLVAPLDDGGAAMELEVGLARPVLLAGRRNVAHLWVSLTGQPTFAAARRPAVNVCLAIERSDSMQGGKMADARESALAALRRLERGDIVSVVAYDDVVQVMVPAAHASDRDAIETVIRDLAPGGRSAALFAAVIKCRGELGKHLDRNRVSRIILLSQGLADVGPGSPAELGALGAQLREEGISVSTVGLGPGLDEPLLSALARRSDGRHVVIAQARDLEPFLDEELAGATAVARDVDVHVRCGPGVRPLRVLGRRADIVGATVTAPIAKIYGRRQHHFVVELEVDPAAGGSHRRLADVAVDFHDLLRERSGQRAQTVVARFSARPADVEAGANPAILAELNELSSDDDASSGRALPRLAAGRVKGAARVRQPTTVRTSGVGRRGDSNDRPQARPVDPRSRLPDLAKLRAAMGDGPLDGLGD